jgi:hypothetical protein
MHKIADALIDALGGTTAVSRLTDAPLSTVHSWRKNGIPRSRLSHLRLAVFAKGIDIDFDRLAEGATPFTAKVAKQAPSDCPPPPFTGKTETRTLSDDLKEAA